MDSDIEKELEAYHLHADVLVESQLYEDGLNHVDGQTSLCFWNGEITFEDLFDDIKKARSDHNTQL